MASDESPTELPRLMERLLSPDELEAVFADLASRVEVTGIVTKGGAMERASKAPMPLDEARAALLNKSIHGLQVRYTFDRREWCDTLIWIGTRVRLVRMDLSDPNPR